MVIFYSLNCLHSFRTKNKLELHEKVFENINFRNVIMPSDHTEILTLWILRFLLT